MNRLWLFLLAAGAVSAGQDAAAQAVRVRARQQGDRRPVVGALVSLRDQAGRVVKQALTDEAGRAFLPAVPGRYLVRGDRIGASGISTEMFNLGNDTVTVTLTMPDALTTLPDLDVVSSAPVVCSLGQAAAGPVATLWSEARKALSAADLTSRQLPMLEVTRYERMFGEGSVITGEHVERFQTDSVLPFIAADPTHLAREGYLERRGGEALFYAPDARVLLSDEFLSGHCFYGLATADSVGLVGLGFEPSAKPSHRGADVRGTLWLDRVSFELRFLDFNYTNLAREFSSGRDGGRVDFIRLPGGGWLTRRWRVRVADRERGGELAVVGGRRGVAVLSGVVVDSLAGVPLAGAVVSVGGRAYQDTTEADGRYRIEVPTAGEFAVSFSHPVVGLVGATVTGKTAQLALGSEVTADFGLPSRTTLEAAECRQRRSSVPGESLVIGRVVDSSGMGQIGAVRIGWGASGVLRPGYRLEVSEGGTTAQVVTDSEGRFRVCGVPDVADLKVSATVGSRRSEASVSRVGPAVATVRLVVP